MNKVVVTGGRMYFSTNIIANKNSKITSFFSKNDFFFLFRVLFYFPAKLCVFFTKKQVAAKTEKSMTIQGVRDKFFRFIHLVTTFGI